MIGQGLPRRALRAAILGLVVFAAFLAVSPDRRSGPKNVIIIVSDSLRASQLEIYGYERPTSPTLSRLEDASIVYDNAYSHYTFTWPTISNLFTGLPYSRLVATGLFSTPTGKQFQFEGGLTSDAPTLAERLADTGVRSYGISASPPVSRRTGFDQGFEKFFDWEDWQRAGLESNIPYVPAERMNAAARQYLRELRWEKRQPWLLYLHYMDTHMAYHATVDDLALFADPGYQREGRVDDGAALTPEGKWLKWRTEEFAEWLEPPDVAHLVAHYDAQIRRFDRALAALLRELEATGLRDDTIVIVTSDHGESLFERGFWGHGYLSRNEEQHVPLIVILPPGEGSPGRVSFPVTTTDIFHSVLSHFGVEAAGDPAPLPQVADVLRGTRLREVAYTEGPGGTRIYRDGRFALYQHRHIQERGHPLPGENGDFLFDLTTDPDERRALRHDAPTTDEAKRRLVAGGPTAMPAENPEDPMFAAGGRLRESLKALGYVED